MQEEIRDAARLLGVVATLTITAALPAAANGAAANGRGLTLRNLIASAHAQGRAAEIAPLLADASRFRPAFGSVDELEQRPSALEISTAGVPPRLVCVPSFIVGSGPHQFVRIARALDGRRNVTALSLPGFGRDELLPATWEVAVEALAGAVREAVADDPFVLVGYSSGGALAHALAETLEREGAPAAGLVLIDSYLPAGDAMGEVFAAIMAELIELDHEAVAIDDDHLISMGAYMRLFREWESTPIEAPALMVRANGLRGLERVDGDELAACRTRRPWSRSTTTTSS